MPKASTRVVCICGAGTKKSHQEKIKAGFYKHTYVGPGKTRGKHALKEGK